jgi:cephalosporin hydroxylase
MPADTQLKSWRDIPGFFDFEDIYDQAVAEAGPKETFVEVGTFLGKSAAYLAGKIAESGKDISLIAVDSWSPEEYAQWWIDVKLRPPVPWPVQELFDKPLYSAFRYCMYKLGLQTAITPLCKSSTDAARLFEDQSLFFVFIDADHSYKGVKSDIGAWMPKVKKGGILAGHDYRTEAWPGVTRAVDEEFGPTAEHRNNSWLVRM